MEMSVTLDLLLVLDGVIDSVVIGWTNWIVVLWKLLSLALYCTAAWLCNMSKISTVATGKVLGDVLPYTPISLLICMKSDKSVMSVIRWHTIQMISIHISCLLPPLVSTMLVRMLWRGVSCFGLVQNIKQLRMKEIRNLMVWANFLDDNTFWHIDWVATCRNSIFRGLPPL